MQVWSRDPGNAADAEVELAAVLRVRVLREGTGGGVGGALRGVMKSFKRRFVTEVIESFFLTNSNIICISENF